MSSNSTPPVSIQFHSSSSVSIQNSSDNNSSDQQQNATAISAASSSPRFTKDEKTILYQLFKDNEEVIDIKYRKNSSKKIISVRECWEKIVDNFNSSPLITTKRNMKQIQKFWLNARLRKNFPSIDSVNNEMATVRNSVPKMKKNKSMQPQHHEERQQGRPKQQKIQQPQTNQKQQKQTQPQYIQQLQIQNQIQPLQKSQTERLQHIKFEAVDNEVETEMEMIDENDIQQIEVSTSSNDVIENTQPHHYNIDHISAEKLTLNDLLEFKNSRSQREEIVFQIKSPVGSSQHKENINLPIYTTPSYRITNSNNVTTFLTTEQQHPYQTIQQTIQPPPLQPKPAPTVVITQQLPPPSQKNNYCSHQQQQQQSAASPSKLVDNLEEKLNFYKFKEAELRYKGEQLRWEQSKIDLQCSREQLKHIKELQAYQVEEVKLKLKILTEEENRTKKKLIIRKNY